MTKQRVLFIGNFLAKTNGTIGPIAGVMNRLKNDFNIISASSFNNKYLRLFDMIWKALTCRYNVIHIDTYSTNAIRFAKITSKIAKVRKKKIILDLRGGALYEQYEKEPLFIKKLFEKANIIITPSLFLQDSFTSKDFNIDYLPNSIDLNLFPYLHGRESNHKLLWVRAFSVGYNPWLAVKTLYELKQKYTDATLTMIGPDKGELARIQQLAKNLKLLDSIVFTGPIPNKELTPYYHNHQVYLNTTQYESFGVAVLEAAATGIPIVSTSVGEIPYLWTDNETIQLIKSFDEKEMAIRVNNYFENVEFSENIASNARKKAETFDWKNVKENWFNVLNETNKT